MYRKTLISIIAGLLMLSGAAFTLSAQDYVAPAVEISKEKVKIGGKIFLSHVVKEKQTLYSISKAYGVTIRELYDCNAKLEQEGLKKNSILLIPFKDKDKKEKADTKKTQSTKIEGQRNEGEKATEVIADVQPETDGEVDGKEKNTEESQQTDTPENDPENRTAESAGAEESPERGEDKLTRDEAEKQEPKTHIVKWFEDISSIADRYGITINELMAANNLKTTRLETRQKLVIPVHGSVFGKKEVDAGSNARIPEQVPTEITADTTVRILPEEESGTDVAEPEKKSVEPESDKADATMALQTSYFPKTSINLTMLLPFQAKGGKASRHFMDYYSGSLLAMKHLKENGINLKTNVFDISNDDIKGLKHEVNNSDLIIGPVTQDDIDTLYTLNHSGVPVVSPLDPKTEDNANKYCNFIFAPTSHNRQYEDLCLWLNEEYVPEDKVIVIFEKDGFESNHHTIIFEQLQKLGIPYTEFGYNILEGRGIQKRLEEQMTNSSANRVIVASESEAFVNDITRNLNLITLRKKKVILYASGKIRTYETIPPEYLHNTNLHASLSYGIDYDDERTRLFINEYRALFNTDPSQFAFQGYDVTRYFIEMIMKYGSFWLDCITEEMVPMLQSSFRFERTAANGFINNAIRRVIFEKNFVVKELHRREIVIKDEEGISEAIFN